jgi:uncharacterized membrane protein YeaQ/YmgE (transglycosylase-associated protein family)
MNKLTLLVVGIVAGWLAEQIMGRSQTLIMNLVLGVAGAFLGSLLATRVLDVRYTEGLNPATIAIATAGALLLLLLAEGLNQTSGSF